MITPLVIQRSPGQYKVQWRKSNVTKSVGKTLRGPQLPQMIEPTFMSNDCPSTWWTNARLCTKPHQLRLTHQWRKDSAPLCVCWRSWSVSASQRNTNESHHSHHITPSYVHTHMHTYRQFFLGNIILIVLRKMKACQTFWCFVRVSDPNRRSRASLGSFTPVLHLSWSLTCPLSWWTLPGYSKQMCFDQHKYALRQQHQGCLQHDFRKAGASRSASLQTYAVQKMIVQSHRTLF